MCVCVCVRVCVCVCVCVCVFVCVLCLLKKQVRFPGGYIFQIGCVFMCPCAVNLEMLFLSGYFYLCLSPRPANKGKALVKKQSQQDLARFCCNYCGKSVVKTAV